MNKLIVRTGLFGLLAAASLGLGGCGNNLKEENAALRDTNAKLESDNIEKAKMLSESESRRNEAEGKAGRPKPRSHAFRASSPRSPRTSPTRPPTPRRAAVPAAVAAAKPHRRRW